MNIIRLLPLTLLLLAAPVLAGTPIEQSHPLADDAHLSIRNVKGRVSVTAWDQDSVRITGSLGSGARKLSIEGDRHDLRIEVQGPEDSGWFNWGNDSRMGPTVLKLQVPRGVSLSVKVVSATVDISGLDGGDIDIDSVSGRVHVDARSPSLEVDSVSANFTLSGHADKVDIDTVSGDVEASQVGARANIETVSGDIRIGGGPYREVAMNTVSGDLDIGGALDDGGSIDIDSMSGDIDLDLRGTPSASLSASSFSGDLRSDYGTVSEHEHGPGSDLHARIGDGDGSITLKTFSGDIHVRGGK